MESNLSREWSFAVLEIARMNIAANIGQSKTLTRLILGRLSDGKQFANMARLAFIVKANDKDKAGYANDTAYHG